MALAIDNSAGNSIGADIFGTRRCIFNQINENKVMFNGTQTENQLNIEGGNPKEIIQQRIANGEIFAIFCSKQWIFAK